MTNAKARRMFEIRVAVDDSLASVMPIE